MGILRPELRVEIYCQICKQLNGNSNKNSTQEDGFYYHYVSVVFAPTDKFVKYLRNFIQKGSPGYAPYCDERFNEHF
jgi:hypothetical protein